MNVARRRLVTSALLTIDLVMALSRDSLMRPLTKLQGCYRFAIKPRILQLLPRSPPATTTVRVAEIYDSVGMSCVLRLFRERQKNYYIGSAVDMK